MSGPTFRRIRLANNAKTGAGPVFGSSADSECFITCNTPGADVHIVHPTSQAVRVGSSYTSGLSIADVAGAVTVGVGAGGSLSLPAFAAPSITLNGTDLGTTLTGLGTDVSAAATDASNALSAATSAGTSASTVATDLAALAARVEALEALMQ
jgi:hypothetical protein